MGRGKSYNLDDYADRLFAHLAEHGPKTTNDLVYGVKGTQVRLMEGLILLRSQQRVKHRIINKHNEILWTARVKA